MSRLQIQSTPEKTPARNPNLRPPFEKGNRAAVGNRGGGRVAKLKAQLLDHFEDDQWHLILQAQVEKALKGDTAAFLAVRDTIGLKPKDVAELTHREEGRTLSAVVAEMMASRERLIMELELDNEFIGEQEGQ